MIFHEIFHTGTRIYNVEFLIEIGYDRKWLFCYFSNRDIQKLGIIFFWKKKYSDDGLIVKIWMMEIIILKVRSVQLRYLWISTSKIQILSYHKNTLKFSEYSLTSHETAKEYSKRWRLIVLSYLHAVIEIMVSLRSYQIWQMPIRDDQSHFEWSIVLKSRDTLNHLGIDIIWFIIRMKIGSYFCIDALIFLDFLIYCKDSKTSYWFVFILLFTYSHLISFLILMR